MKDENRRMMSMACLLGALVLFVVFHFQEVDRVSDKRGWRVWFDIWEMIQNPQGLFPSVFVLWALFLNFSIIVVVSPFLKNVWPKSLWAWWAALIFSGMTAVAFWIMVRDSSPDRSFDQLGIGGWSMMFSPVFNFTGLLLARFGVSRPQLPGI